MSLEVCHAVVVYCVGAIENLTVVNALAKVALARKTTNN